MSPGALGWMRRVPWGAFVGMWCFLVGFGILSLNLYFLLSANLQFIREHGVIALKDGGAVQLGEILVQGLLASACYAGLKVCEKLFVERWTQGKWPGSVERKR